MLILSHRCCAPYGSTGSLAGAFDRISITWVPAIHCIIQILALMSPPTYSGESFAHSEQASHAHHSFAARGILVTRIHSVSKKHPWRTSDTSSRILTNAATTQSAHRNKRLLSDDLKPKRQAPGRDGADRPSSVSRAICHPSHALPAFMPTGIADTQRLR